ncbi:hypothetical protein ACQE3E_16080 [Methylomonas sp. MED-D]|uniref:hypothetical protein n=1 Tax=unclassified Methylomonas TaxID=2608980 RepID=UPI00247AF549|nr:MULTISPECIES: hypothetical protein [unclassified Methylomonas]MDT4331124.1 hypothetical protein [Methylomonas sp. MV1]WGS84723.1 hypothetical protein QC632_16890 [Methylomonas sp. UP202]
MRKLHLIALFTLSPVVLGENIKNFSTPEQAIQFLEEAYRRKSIDDAVSAKDFFEEGRLMLQNINPEFSKDGGLVKQAAETLELAYRKEMETKGFPDLEGLKCSFPAKETLETDLVKVTEVCIFPDGRNSRQNILVKKGNNGWRVLNVTD